MIGLWAGLATLPALWVAAPEVVAVQPSPLPLMATAEVTGAGFADGASVVIGEVTQRVILVEAGRLRFLTAAATPLGPQTLTVSLGGESAAIAIEVVPPVPLVHDVEPATLVLGRLGTVTGEGLATVTALTLDGEPCALSEQTDSLIVFEVPFVARLLGSATLVLESPSGVVTEEVVVTAPPPQIDALVPNPVRAGSLFRVRGLMAPLPTRVTVAAVEVPVLELTLGGAGTSELVAWLPTTLAPKPYDVVVISGAESSSPAGPLIVEAAATRAPAVSGAYPGRLAAGGELWVAGEQLDAIQGATGGLTVIGCERRACRLASVGVAPGVMTAALTGPDGAGVFALEVVEEAAVVPVITRVEPSPAFRGETLVIHGSQLAGARSVVLGGVAQSIAFVDVDRVAIVVQAGTPLGAETLFVSGNAGSLPLTVTVLDPLPIEVGPEVAEVDATVEAVEPGVETSEGPREDDGGCGGGAAGAAGMALLAATRGLSRWRRRQGLARWRRPRL